MKKSESFKVKYNAETGAVEGFFINSIDYKNNIIDEDKKTIDGSPYIEIDEEEHKNRPIGELCVENGKIVSRKKSLEEIKEEKTKEIKIATRKHIYSVYSEIDQRNILMDGDLEEIAKMNEFIKEIRTRSKELRDDLDDLSREQIESLPINLA